MKKLLISSVVALGLSISASLAEESGVFVGVGAGYGVANIKEQILISSSSESRVDSQDKGAAYEILAGYKHFITPHLGFRLFANFIYTDAKHKDSQSGESRRANVMSYMINFDALYNFIASSNTNFGVFVGIGAGANTWGGKAFDEIPSSIMTKTSFDFALNFGLRSVIARHHGIEIAARMPFEEQYIVNDTIPGSNIYMNLRGAYKYSVSARYIYNF
ncbi:outer membrane beta-barrel protein [Helicobacter japonicus]|uniref:Outer membrane beta-barrel protein n=2 Tax=Helicobacter japonicus TaxID=425400 RepID=A0A4U8TNJ2_9HELI|nr:outer membrane beta-barrel protein [Helicobacter japonicus]TLE02057.1 outer membrane beta-barrel protein [Helicobacter japonicus]